MASSEDRQQQPASDPSSVGLVWIGADRATVVRWTDQPIVEHLFGEVPPKRRAVGSVRRGPARPSGGGRVPGHGTEEQHEQELRRFLADVVARLTDLEAVEVIGHGLHPERLADLLRRFAARSHVGTVVTTRGLARRPSDNQLKARLRKLAGSELPRRRIGRHRLPVPEPATETGRPLRPAAGRRTLRPPRLTERREIDQEVEAMLADGPWDPTGESPQP
jgi:hypothetical protein